MADAGRRGCRTVPRLWGHLSGDRSPPDPAGVVWGHPAHVVAGGDAPRSVGAGGRPVAPVLRRWPGPGLPGHADRPVGCGRADRVYLRRAAGPAAWDPGSRVHVLDATTGLEIRDSTRRTVEREFPEVANPESPIP